MQLKKLTMQNFRQFKNETIEFAQGKDGKNVTIVIGENGSGKTTIEQSFSWCFYGKSGFSDKVLLNRDVTMAMVPGETKSVKVSIVLTYNDTTYLLIREQSYEKNRGDKVVVKETTFNIQQTGADGQPKWVKPSECASVVSNIMPEVMSNYFFFDGERIEKMGKEISEDKKVTDFKNAVEGLLGLDAIKEARDHMNPNRKYSAIGLLEKSFEKGTGNKVSVLTSQIAKAQERVDEIDIQLGSIESEIERCDDLIAKKTAKIMQYDDGKKLLEKRDRVQDQLENEEESLLITYKEIAEKFSSNFGAFVSLSMMKRSMEYIKSQNLGQYDLPYVREETINYLLRHKECLCGRPLAEHTPEYEHVRSLIDVLPPKSLGAVAKEFRTTVNARINQSQDMKDATTEYFERVSRKQEKIEGLKRELSQIQKELTGGDVREKVKQLESEIRSCEKVKREAVAQRDDLKQEQFKHNNDIDNWKAERTRLNIQNEDNLKTERYLAYAHRIYEDLNDIYTKAEKEVRERLERTINELFLELYNGKLTLEIKTNYRIRVIDMDYESGVETSDGQNISVIFAFISAIIKLAKENKESENQYLSSETYPLVMDAPLSTFDTTRIDNVCRMLPTIAEQVVIFIKDTDGNLAKEKLGDKIGRSYRFLPVGQFETHIKGETV